MKVFTNVFTVISAINPFLNNFKLCTKQYYITILMLNVDVNVHKKVCLFMNLHLLEYVSPIFSCIQ